MCLVYVFVYLNVLLVQYTSGSSEHLSVCQHVTLCFILTGWLALRFALVYLVFYRKIEGKHL